PMTRFLLGINYWPVRSAMYAWERFDLGEIREDLTRIKGLGLDVVRFFLLWQAFQPQPDRMDTGTLSNFQAMMDAVAEAGLHAMPTLFCGHMSGVNWLPAWTLDAQTPHGRFRTVTGDGESPYGIGDLYADPFLLDAQERFARAAGERVRNHPALLAWDLGNEFSNLREPASPHDAARWSERLTHALHETSGAPSTGGTHGEDLERDRNLRLSSLAAPWPYATMHGYPVYSKWARDRSDANVVPFLMQLTQTFSTKRVLFSELGNPTCHPEGAPSSEMQCLSEDEMAPYCHEAIDRLHARGALGAFWWCWADYAPELQTLPPFDRAPHELSFGIVRPDGSFKPVASALAKIAAEARTVTDPQPSILTESEDAYYSSLPEGIFERYREYCAVYGD
ncbi:MAG: beta-galactosidase, partial [Candidatus Eremiobacteraeota bacterium]|nr:beta-galactosidase [Candidatus Eremiobacteraeota bacterium]